MLNASTGRNNSTENKLKQFIISESYASGFALALMAKDIQTADELAHQIGVNAPLADEITAMWDAALKQLGPSRTIPRSAAISLPTSELHRCASLNGSSIICGSARHAGSESVSRAAFRCACALRSMITPMTS